MAVVLEERCSREVICRDEPIEALKKENETLEEVKGFSSTRQEVELLRKERDELKVGSKVLMMEKEVEASAAILHTSASKAGRA